MIMEQNYLEVYSRYDSWRANNIPVFRVNEEFVPTSLEMHQGVTSAPPPLAEVDLLSQMEKYGIGT